jgi:hypothetical protein
MDTVGTALARMQEVIEVNILILIYGIQTTYYIDNVCSIVYEFLWFEGNEFYKPSLVLHTHKSFFYFPVLS